MNKTSAAIRVAVAAALAFTLVALLVQLGLTKPWDEAGLRALLALRTPGRTSLMRVFTTAGSVVCVMPFALLFSAWLWRTRGRPTATFYIVTSLTGWGMYALLKLLFGRARPTLIPRLSGAGWVSFPSGHSMTSTVIIGLAMVLATERARSAGSSRLILLAGSVAIAGVALSRVYLGVHYPSDVLGGILGGITWVGGSLALARPRMAPASA